MYDILYSFNQKPSEFNEAKVLTGSGLESAEVEKLKKLYFDPNLGSSVINELSRKSGSSQKKVKEFLEQKDIYTLHRPIRRKFQTRRVYALSIDHAWQCDLAQMQNYAKENGFRYMLNMIDVFIKYASILV